MNDPSGRNVVQIILEGTGTAGTPTCPASAAPISDAEIAAVANQVTAPFGSVQSRVTPAD